MEELELQRMKLMEKDLPVRNILKKIEIILNGVFYLDFFLGICLRILERRD